jgi:hypothetical protein
MDALSRDGLEVDGQRVAITFTLGGDLKFLNGVLGLQGASATCPCHICEVTKAELHWSKRRHQQKYGCQPVLRTYLRCAQMAHAFGADVGIIEPYLCPGCNMVITEDDRHEPAEGKGVARAFGLAHFSQRWGCFPLLRVQPSDLVCDILHALLRLTAAVFWATVTMNTTTDELAKAIADFISDKLNVNTLPTKVSANTAVTKKDLQSWGGDECRTVMQHYMQILKMVFPAGEKTPGASWELATTPWEAFIELYAVWNMDVPEEDYELLACKLDTVAETFIGCYIAVSSAEDITPTMHCVQNHFGDLLRAHGCLAAHCCQGLEHKHQIVKKIGHQHCNKHVANSGVREGKPAGDMGCIKQIAVRMAWEGSVPLPGKATKKWNGKITPLQDTVARMQQSVLHWIAAEKSALASM